jgi:hypothetical protein
VALHLKGIGGHQDEPSFDLDLPIQIVYMETRVGPGLAQAKYTLAYLPGTNG